MKHFGKNRFISFFALLLVLTLALSMNSVFAADTAATGTESAVQQESGESPASKGSNSAVSEQNPEQNQEQKPENSASPENPTTPESPKNLGWVSDNNETRYYDTENHFVTGMNTIEGKKYYFNNDGILQRGILKIGKAYYYADGKGVIRTAKGRFRWKSNTYYCNKSGKLTTKKMIKSGKYYYYFDSAAKAKTKAFKYHDVTIRPNKKTGAITKKQYRRASYGPYNYKNVFWSISAIRR